MKPSTKIALFLLYLSIGFFSIVFSIGYRMARYSNTHYTYKIEQIGDNNQIINTWFTHKYSLEGADRFGPASTIEFIPLKSKNRIGFNGKWRITETTNP